MVKNIIFDIGNVILTFNRDFLLSNFYQGEEFEFLKEKTFYGWEELDEDLISVEEYKKRVASSLPDHLKGYALAVLNNWEYYMNYNRSIFDFIFELKQKGYKIYALSNMPKHFINIDYKFPIFDQFDGVVYSAPLSIVKPNPKIYEHILEKYSAVSLSLVARNTCMLQLERIISATSGPYFALNWLNA
jgi:putative hydrolase of the HAD superfamily